MLARQKTLPCTSNHAYRLKGSHGSPHDSRSSRILSYRICIVYRILPLHATHDHGLLYMLLAAMHDQTFIDQQKSIFFFCLYVLSWLRVEGSAFSWPFSWPPPCSRRRPRQQPTRHGLAPGATTLLRHQHPRCTRPPPCRRPRRPPRSHPNLPPPPPWPRHRLAMARRCPVPPRQARRRRLGRWSPP